MREIKRLRVIFFVLIIVLLVSLMAFAFQSMTGNQTRLPGLRERFKLGIIPLTTPTPSCIDAYPKFGMSAGVFWKTGDSSYNYFASACEGNILKYRVCNLSTGLYDVRTFDCSQLILTPVCKQYRFSGVRQKIGRNSYLKENRAGCFASTDSNPFLIFDSLEYVYECIKISNGVKYKPSEWSSYEVKYNFCDNRGEISERVGDSKYGVDAVVYDCPERHFVRTMKAWCPNGMRLCKETPSTLGGRDVSCVAPAWI